jgi:amphiphysin
MMEHQIQFSRAIKEIYQPISGRVSDPDSIVHEGNEAGIEACEQYEAAVQDLKETLAPELEMIESRVIAPADELLSIIKIVRKSTVKRQHKQLDYDRHNANYQKIKDKKDKSLKDEKAMYKAEAELEQSTQDFNYFNDLLKDELPQLFKLEREFIRPLFQSFYYMQLNVFYTLHEKMQSIDIGYFNLTLGIEEAFEEKVGDTRDRADQLTITAFKKTGGKRPSGTTGKYVSKYALKNEAHNESTSSAVVRRRSEESLTSPPPPYSPTKSPAMGSIADNMMGRSNSVGSNWGAAAKAKGAAPPPPKPKPSRLSGVPATMATALYDYEAQAEGDLSFSTGDVIEVTKKGATENEWWTGRLNGKIGQFPGEQHAEYDIHETTLLTLDRKLCQAQLMLFASWY